MKQIAINFDNTIIYEGQEVPHSIRVIKQLINNNHYLILNTTRYGTKLGEAINYLYSNGIEFNEINDNEYQHNWTRSRKIYADIYIDFNSLNIPTVDNKYVDWLEVEKLLKIKGLI